MLRLGVQHTVPRLLAWLAHAFPPFLGNLGKEIFECYNTLGTIANIVEEKVATPPRSQEHVRARVGEIM